MATMQSWDQLGPAPRAVQTLGADLGIPEEVALALDPSIPTIAPPLKTLSSSECLSGRAQEQAAVQ